MEIEVRLPEDGQHAFLHSIGEDAEGWYIDTIFNWGTCGHTRIMLMAEPVSGMFWYWIPLDVTYGGKELG